MAEILWSPQAIADGESILRRPRVNAKSLGRGRDHMKHVLVLILFGACSVASPAFAQLIGVYQDPLATSCNLAVAYPGSAVNAYVVFTPGGGIDAIEGARLRIDGLPSGWSATEVANPTADRADGNLFDLGGQIYFADCVAGPLVLWQVTLTPTSAVTEHQLVVRFHLAQPVDIGGGVVCPQFLSCDPDRPGGVLAEAVASINSAATCSPRLEGRCPLASDVQEPPSYSWGVVKLLYRKP